MNPVAAELRSIKEHPPRPPMPPAASRPHAPSELAAMKRRAALLRKQGQLVYDVHK